MTKGTLEPHICSKRVFSGERWDMGGHPCSRKATVERDGKWWCTQHDPAREEARKQAALTARQEADRRERERQHRALELAAQLGVGHPYFDPHRLGYTGGVVLTEAEAKRLVAQLETLRREKASAIQSLVRLSEAEGE